MQICFIGGLQEGRKERKIPGVIAYLFFALKVLRVMHDLDTTPTRTQYVLLSFLTGICRVFKIIRLCAIHDVARTINACFDLPEESFPDGCR